MKSRILRWYNRHEEAVNAVLDITCDLIPGGGVVKGILNIGQGIDNDTEEEQTQQKIQYLEQLLEEIKPKISDIVEEIEELQEFKQGMNIDEIRKVIDSHQEIHQEIQSVVPQISPSVTSSAESLNILYKKEKVYETIASGKYTLESCIAAGGQGKVYSGQNTVVDTQVAIKLLSEEFTTNTSGVGMLKSEYKRLVGKLSHRYIVQYRDLDFSKEKNQWFIIMDYIEGDTLRKKIIEKYREPFTTKETYALLHPVALALEHAHKNNVVHCDLKPENILIRKDGQAFLTDFGLSREVRQSIVSISGGKNTNIGGTLPYMAPEQYRGWGVSKQTDVWSFGVLLYEMLAGNHPFYGTSYEHYKDIICNEEARPLENEKLWNIVQQALTKDSTQRIGSVVELVKQLYEEAVEIVEKEDKKQQEKIEEKKSFLQSDLKKVSVVKYEESAKAIDEEESVLVEAAHQYEEAKEYESAKELYQKLANDYDNAEAMCRLGVFYSKACGVEKDFEKAERWFVRSMKAGSSKALWHLGEFYSQIKGDNKKGREFHTKAAHAGNIDSMYLLADVHIGEDNEEQSVFWRKKAALGGHDEAMYEIAVMYERGDGVKQDYQKAREWYEALVKNHNNAKAMCKLGVFYTEGYGGSENHEEAQEWFTRSIKNGSNEALWHLGDFHWYVEGDEKKAREYYIKAANTGNIDAMYLLSHVYIGEEAIKNIGAVDKEQAIFWKKKAALAGHDEAMYELAELYESGSEEVNQDYKKARELYQKLADDYDNTKAMYKLGVFYNQGYGGKKNLIRSRMWLKKAADAGNVEAMCYLGDFYWDIIDRKNAGKYYQKAARAGDVDAMYKLCETYKNGDEIDTKYRGMFVRWCTQAAKGGNSNAMYEIGRLREQGTLVRKNEDKALEWYKQAADKNNVLAMKHLSRVYEEGLCGVEKDDHEVFFWKEKAAYEKDYEAMFELATFYKYGNYCEQDHKKALEWFEKSAEGLAGPLSNVIEYYEKGIGVDKDIAKVIEWCEKSIEWHESEYGMKKLAEIYEHGSEGVKKDYSKAKYWYGELGKRKDESAILKLCKIYQEGLMGEEVDHSKAIEWYEKIIDENPMAMYEIGMIYENGSKEIQDATKALEWYKKSVDEWENPLSMYRLGALYEFNAEKKNAKQEGNKKSLDWYQDAREWYEKASECDHGESIYRLGYLYQRGNGVKVNYEKAKEYYEKAAELENIDALRQLGFFYVLGYGGVQDYALAFEYYNKAAKLGDENAMCNLGRMYEDGQGIKVDYTKARKWYKQAADLGNKDSIFYIGSMYEDGKGVKQDYREAKKWYEQAIEKESENAMSALGSLYLFGHGVEKNYSKAKALYEKASELGCVGAFCNLGVVYENGLGVKEDCLKAKDYYEKAIEQGDDVTMHQVVFAKKQLAGIYLQGKGIKKDVKKAIEYYEGAAKYQDESSMYKLGVLYFNGDEIKQDYPKAKKWFEQAGRHGSSSAYVILARMYYQELGVRRDDDKIAYYMTKAEEMGYDFSSEK